jgi:hypothetical protein
LRLWRQSSVAHLSILGWRTHPGLLMPLYAERAESGLTRPYAWTRPTVDAGGGTISAACWDKMSERYPWSGHPLEFRVSRSPFPHPDHANARRSGGDVPGLQFHGRPWNLATGQVLGQFVSKRERPRDQQAGHQLRHFVRAGSPGNAHRQAEKERRTRTKCPTSSGGIRSGVGAITGDSLPGLLLPLHADRAESGVNTTARLDATCSGRR